MIFSIKKIIYTTLVIIFAQNLNANNWFNGPDDSLKTQKAVVVYGNTNNQTDLNQEALSILELDNILDSLVAAEPFNEDAYNHYKTLKLSYLKSEEELVLMIEEFFNQDEIPFETINELNRYIALNDEYSSKPKVNFNPFAYCEPYPATGLYGNFWDTEKPVSDYKGLWAYLTVNKIPLVEPENECNFVMPHEGKLTSNFGWRYGRTHNGIDIAIKMRDPIKSAFDGMVRYAGYYGSFGRVVVVRHYNGLETLYAHLNKSTVKVGQVVSAGDIIGEGGTSGRSTGPHLHFEARFLGQPINPRYFIDVANNKLKIETIELDEWRSSSDSEPGKFVHKVQTGDSLSKIAKRYGTSIQSLCKSNNIKTNSILRPGQKLIVYAQNN